jgi:hypothetical protein
MVLGLSLYGDMDVGMVKEIIQLFWSIRPDHKCVIHIMEPPSRLVGHPHGPKEPNDFLKHFNNIHFNIQFTMETDSNGLPGY